MNKEAFKKFVRNHPDLVNYVRDNKMTWQQFYEIYDLYGEDDSIWNNFLNKDTNSNFNLKDVVNFFKGIDTETVNKVVTSINKVIDTIKEFNGNNKVSDTYSERPKYKYYED